MKTLKVLPTVLGLSALLALQGAMPVFRAQETTYPTTPTPHAGPEFHPFINQNTNPVVTARQVMLTKGGQPWLVLFNSQTKEALVGSSTNRTCLLDGRMFRVDRGDRGFLVTPSKPLGAAQYTEQKAIELAEEASHGELGTKRIDLRDLLKQERELQLANPLGLQDVTLRPAGTNLLVNFVSATGLKGAVMLDQQLNVLSMTLADSKK